MHTYKIIRMKPKIYFACSIRGGRENAHIYGGLVASIKENAEVLSEIFAEQSLTPAGMSRASTEIYKKDIAWIHEADAIIAEATTPSLGVGYEIATAEALHKPVLVLFKNSERKLSAMIDGSPLSTVVYYTDLAEAKQAIRDFIVIIQPQSVNT